MDWLCDDVLFALFDADSGVIPTMTRVCRQWRAATREYIRLYRDHALTIHVSLGTRPTIYTTTSDGVMNGLYIVYTYLPSPFLPGTIGFSYLAPVEITEKCNGQSHGRSVIFENGEICEYKIYNMDNIVSTTRIETYDLYYIRILIRKLRDTTQLHDEALKLTAVNRGATCFKFTPDGRIHHKIPIGSNYANISENEHCRLNVLFSYQNGSRQLQVRMIQHHWITDAIYYNPDGSVKMAFMNQFDGTAWHEINHDNGYRFLRVSDEDNAHIRVYDTSGEIVFEHSNSAGKTHICDAESHTDYCQKCRSIQMRREFGTMWRRINAIARRYKY